jgi:hypothetical protein
VEGGREAEFVFIISFQKSYYFPNFINGEIGPQKSLLICIVLEYESKIMLIIILYVIFSLIFMNNSVLSKRMNGALRAREKSK